jgi:preprotein translocase subunit SecG
VRILYGGSVNAENAAELLAADEVGGALVGGASLTAESFGGIIAAAAARSRAERAARGVAAATQGACAPRCAASRRRFAPYDADAPRLQVSPPCRSLFIFLTVFRPLSPSCWWGDLIQKSEGGGLGVGGSPAGFMSARGAADFMTRMTQVLAACSWCSRSLAAWRCRTARPDASMIRSTARCPARRSPRRSAGQAGGGGSRELRPLPADPLAGAAKSKRIAGMMAPLPSGGVVGCCRGPLWWAFRLRRTTVDCGFGASARLSSPF